MKKNYSFLFSSMMCMAALFMTSCGGDDKNTDPDPDPEKPTVTTVEVKYELPNLAVLMQLTDIDVTYTDAAGKAVSESVKGTSWSKEVKGVTLPFDAKIQMKFKRKTGLTYTGTYKINASHAFYMKSDPSGIYNGTEGTLELTIGSAKIEAYLDELVSKGITYTKSYAK